MPGETADYDYALTVIPGEALRFVYEKYGARLLEANVRSFLSVTGKVNKGIRDTLRRTPGALHGLQQRHRHCRRRSAASDRPPMAAPGILWLKGMQIVNGGQTTASIYFTKKKSSGDRSARVSGCRRRSSCFESRGPCGGGGADLRHLAIRQQPELREAVRPVGQQAVPRRDREAGAVDVLPGRRRPLVLRARGRQLQHDAGAEGTTPARLKQLKEVVIPPSRKITKTDLAKYLNAWDQKPDLVSLGSQKNFERFMEDVAKAEESGFGQLPDVAAYKVMIAKAILFKKAHALVRPMFPAFQANVAAYTVSCSRIVGR